MFSDTFRRIPRLLLPLVLAVFAAGANADEAPLGLAELIRLAIKNNPTLAAQRYTVEAAEGRQQQAGSMPNPRLELSNTSNSFLSNGGE